MNDRRRLGFNKLEWSWIFYDWANSVFSLMITTAVFPLFYNGIAEGSGISAANSTAYLGYANSIATFLVGLSAPLLGIIAEYKGYRSKMFNMSVALGLVAILVMGFMPLGEAHWTWISLLILYVISSIGFSTANIFYDATLSDVTTRDRMSIVSSAGYGMGYIGSSIPFVLFVIATLNIDALPIGMTTLTQFSFIGTALWWFVFTIPYWINIKQKNGTPPDARPIRSAFKRLSQTFLNIKNNRNVFLFLSAYFLYIDGVGTIIKMATSVGSDIGISSSNLIVVLLLVQIIAFPFSILYGYLSRHFGEKKMIYVGVLTYIGICLLALRMTEVWHFYLLAVLVGTAQGGIQSLSRSYFGKLIPKNRNNEFFGIYNIFGKFSSILGTTLLALTTQMTGNSLDGIFSIIILFLLGAVLLFFVKNPESEEE